MIYDKKTFGEVVRNRRKELGYSVAELAFRSRVNEKTVSRIENGKHICTLETIEKLSIGLELDVLLGYYKHMMGYENNIYSILQQFKEDLKFRKYNKASIRIDELKLIRKSLIDKDNNNNLISLIDKSTEWIENVALSVNGENYKVIETRFRELLEINSKYTIASGIINKELECIDLYILNSVVANRARNDVVSDSIAILEHVMKYIMDEGIDDNNLYMNTLVNLCNHYLEKRRYDDVLKCAVTGIEMAEVLHDISYKTEFDYFIRLIDYVKSSSNETKELEFILKSFEYQGKESVIDDMEKNMKEKFHVMLN